MARRENIKTRVERGANLLDETFPGWHKVIDLETLRLASCQDCVCGQIACAASEGILPTRSKYAKHGYHGMLRYLGYRVLGRRMNLPSFKYGFNVLDDENEFERLDREWGRLIRRRLREEAKAA